MRVRWLRTALKNLDEEIDYIAQDNPAVAAKVARTIQSAVENLTQYPGMGRPGRVTSTRELVIPGTPYIIPYRVRGGAVEVLRIFHGSRKWPSQFTP